MLGIRTLAATGIAALVGLGASAEAANRGQHTPAEDLPTTSQQSAQSGDSQKPMMDQGHMAMMNHHAGPSMMGRPQRQPLP